MTRGARVRLAPDVVAVRVARETVCWNSTTGKLNLLDPIASEVLARLDGRTTAEVVDDLCAVFAAPADRIRRDVEALLSELEQFGVLAGGCSR